MHFSCENWFTFIPWCNTVARPLYAVVFTRVKSLATWGISSLLIELAATFCPLCQDRSCLHFALLMLESLSVCILLSLIILILSQSIYVPDNHVQLNNNLWTVVRTGKSNYKCAFPNLINQFVLCRYHRCPVQICSLVIILTMLVRVTVKVVPAVVLRSADVLFSLHS